MTTKIPDSMIENPGVGVGGTTRIAFNTALNLSGSYAAPLTAGAVVPINSPTTLTIAGGAVEGGEYGAIFSLASTLTLPSVSPLGGSMIVKYSDGTSLDTGYKWQITLGIESGDLVIICFRLAAVDATAPTLVSATVANATPGRVDLVFSESLNATWSAFSAFSVSGHTVTGITRLTATTGYLTVSAPFVNGEAARTVGYTQPGTNNMQDLAGNLLANISGASITNNVATAPVFSDSTVANATVGVAYADGYAASNTTSYAVTAGALPAGLTLNTSTGAITGTPTTAGAPSHTVSATGPGGTTAAPSRTITVAAASAGRVDNFNRANQSGLGTPSDGGSAWENSSMFSIVGNQLATPAAGTGGVTLLSGCPADGTFVLDLAAAFNGGDYSIPGIVFRAVDTSNYLCFRVAGDGSYVLEQVVAGSGTTLASGSGPVVDGNTADGRLRVITSGTSIQCYAGQIPTSVPLIASFTTTQFQTATKAGVFVYQSSGASRLDNFSAT